MQPGPTVTVDPTVANLTPDDLARGIWDLKKTPGGIHPDQVATLQQHLSEGAKIRRRVEEQRVERAEAQRRWLEDGSGIAEILGNNRLKQMGRSP